MALEHSVKKQEKTRSSRLLRWLPLGLIAVAIVSIFATGANQFVSAEFLVRHYAEMTAYVAEHFAFALLAYALLYVAVTALSIPGALVLTIAGGLFFGGLLGGTVILFAATAGATLIFLIARTSLGESLRQRAGPGLEKLRKGFQEDAASYLLFLRLVPVFPFWLVNLAPALFGVSLPLYVLTTFVGILPGTFAYSFIGAGVDEAVAAEAERLTQCAAAGRAECAVSLSFSDFINTELIIAFSVVGIIALLPALYKRFGRGALRAKK